MTATWNKWNKYWKMWNYINMSANHVRLLQFSGWRHGLFGGNSDSLTAECVILWSSAGWRSVGFRGLFTGGRRHAVDLNGTEFKKQKKKSAILSAIHPHDSFFRFKRPSLLCFIIKCTSFPGCRSIQITLKGPGEGLHILYDRCQLSDILVFYKWAQCRTIASVCQCWHTFLATFNAMQNKQNKKQQ